MTDEQAPRGSGDEQGGPASELSAAMDSLTGGQRWLALGAAIIAVDYLIFAIVLDEYSYFMGTLLVAALTLAGLWVASSRPDAIWPVPATWLFKVFGYSAGFLGVVELLLDLRIGILDNAVDLLGGLGLYVGAFLMWWGASRLDAT